MVQAKDASFKFISKKHLKLLFKILKISFDMELDFDDVEVLTSEEVIIEPSLMRPDYVVRISGVIFMIEFESSHVGTKKKKLFRLYVSAYDYKNNDENNPIIFFVISTKEKSKMAEYKLNKWDSFRFPIISLDDLDREEIINNIETKIENNVEFNDVEILELGLTPVLEKDRESIIRQFFQTKDLMGKIDYPNEEIKSSVYGLVLMLSSMFFDELDPLREKLQGDLMGKVDCVKEACQNSYNDGRSDGRSEGVSEERRGIALNMLAEGYSLESISRCTTLSIEDIEMLKGD